MKTKKALAGRLGLLGSFPVFFNPFWPPPAPFTFSLTTNPKFKIKFIERNEIGFVSYDPETKSAHLASNLLVLALDFPPFMAKPVRNQKREQKNKRTG